jgi:ribosomal protein S18 acetylase RimI-like enzyme
MRVVAVDGSKPAISALLQYLQLTCLPYDDPLDTSKAHWWVVYDGQLPVGFACLQASVQWSDTGYLSRSGVIPSYRGRGIQKRLLTVRESKAKRLGWRWLVSDTFDNPASGNSLIVRGFRLFKPSKPWGFDAALYWRKELTNI